MELKKEIHTLIVWSKASHVVNDVEEKLISKFNLISKFDISWGKKVFLENLKVLYSHSQKHITEEDYNNVLKRKIDTCGSDDFTLFVYEDIEPVYDYRITSSGNRKVNTNIFDFKSKLRQGLGGGHQIHASDNVFESNKDLTLLLGLNCKDFLKSIDKKGVQKTKFTENCIGVDGYKNINELFYVLNNCIEYCVIRNFECLPDDYTIEGHGDIDLLVEDLNYIKYLTLAKSYYPELDYRVHYGIKIANELIPFDFRFVGDNYYDINWQNEILCTSKVFRSLVRVPNNKNYFFSLMYHAYVQKNHVKCDYFERLENLAYPLKLDYNRNWTKEEVKVCLDEFMRSNNYTYTIPKDKTVLCNYSFIKHDSSRVDRFGSLISFQQARLDNKVLFTEVYDNGLDITKYGSELIIRNEIKFLEILANTGLVPKIKSVVFNKNEHFLVMEKLNGVQLNQAIDNPLFWKKKNIISFVSQCIMFNKIMIKNNIFHRDIRPQNILISFNEKKEIKVHLIDFGWATLITKIKESPNPIGLGSKYKYSEGLYSDLYSTRKVLEELFKGFKFKEKVKKNFDFKPDVYFDVMTLQKNFNQVESHVLSSVQEFSHRDSLIAFIRRNKVVFDLLIKIKRLFKIKVK